MPNRDDVINEGFDLVSYLIKKQDPKVTVELPGIQELEERFHQIYGPRAEAESAPEVESVSKVSEKERPRLSGGPEALSRGTACLPCSQDHLSTCSGLLAEALRFARNDGIESTEVISRLGLCRDELNALERVDLRPEVTSQLPDWENKLVGDVLNGSRNLRHDMTEILSVSDLEAVAGRAQVLRRDIGKAWLVERLKRMAPGQREVVEQKLQEKLSLDQAKKVAAEVASKEVEERWNSQEKK
jgi:hypothetical protein